MTDFDLALAATVKAARQYRVLDASDVREVAQRNLPIDAVDRAASILMDRGALHRGRHWKYHSTIYDGFGGVSL